MIKKLNAIIDKYNELSVELSIPEIVSDINLYKKKRIVQIYKK